MKNLNTQMLRNTGQFKLKISKILKEFFGKLSQIIVRYTSRGWPMMALWNII